MKKIILCLLLSFFLLPQAAFSNDNFIYSINVNRTNNDKNIHLNIKSDYKTKTINKIDATGREYFDIKDASLKENFSIQYNNAVGVESVIAQQIGNKVRVYIKADDINDISITFNNVENQPYPDKSAGHALLVFTVLVFALFRAFKKKAKRLNAKARYLQNTTSKLVYKELMERKNTVKNIKSIEEYQKQRFINQVAM